MEYVNLTGTGLRVSKICLGTMTFGDQVDEAEAKRLTHFALEEGINFIDTANVYTKGRSEEFVGKAIRGHRHKIILATKVGLPMGEGPNCSGLSRKHVLEQLDKSLKRLQTDYLDIYYMHLPDVIAPIEEILDTFTTIIRSGKARYVGVSNMPAWMVCQMLWESDKHNCIAPSVCQVVYNMVTRGIEQEFVPFTVKNKLGVVVYNSLAGGILTGKHKRGKPKEDTRFALNENYYNRYWNEDNFNAVDELTKIADQMGISLIDLAMRWCISNDFVNSVITGFSNKEQLVQNLKSISKGRLPNDVLNLCNIVWNNISGNRFQYNR